MHKAAIALLVVLLLSTLSCGKLNEITAPVDSEPIDPTATFTRVQNEVFTQSCTAVGCHDRIGQQSQLVLVSGQSYANIVNVRSVEMPALMRIQPNDPLNSYLYRKIVGAGITGDRMPQGGPFLNDSQTALVRNWIRRGAPND